MEVYAIINQKGGVGKTTTADAIGAGLALKGYKTLFIDLDAQGNLSYSLGAATTGAKTSFDLLANRATAQETIQHTARGDVIASAPALGGADAIITDAGKEYRLKEALEPVTGQYDYIVIDTPPALGIATINALTAATGVIIPAQASLYSLQGITQLYSTIETVKRYSNPALTVKGILLTLYNPRTIISRELTEAAEDTARQLNTKLYKTRIRRTTAIEEAQTRRESIYSYAPRSNATADYTTLIEEILRG